VLLVATHRPEYVPPWTGQSGVTSVALSRLTRREGAQLVAKVAGDRPLPPEVLDEILARTDGVPLFVEELTKSVLESGLLRDAGDRYALQTPLSPLAIPTSLRDSLVARLDRLAPIKEIAQIGACIGREFSYDLLARVASIDDRQLESALERLAEAGLVVRRGAPPEATYTFKHALVQDAAYDSLLKSRRTQLHASIARVLAAHFADRVAGKPEWLAHHHTQAGNIAAAVPLWRAAGELALARVALREAVAHFQKGLALIQQLPPSADRDALELGIREPLNAAWVGLRGWAAAEIDENTTSTLVLAKSQGNARSLLLGLWWIWTSTITQGHIADSLEWADRLLAEGRETGDRDMQIVAHAAAMVPHFFLGRLAEARAHSERALALYDPQRAEAWIQLTGHDLSTFVDVYTCQLLWMQGYPDQARALSERTTARARELGHPFNLAWALTFSAYAFVYRREPARVLEQVGEADRLARDQGLAFVYEVSVPQAAGFGYLHDRRPADAIPLFRAGLARWTQAGGHVRVPYIKAALAEALAQQGDSEAALALIAESLEQIERPGWEERLWLPEILRLQGWILARVGRRADAEAPLRAAVACAREQGARSWELRSATSLARLLAGRGERDDARGLLTPIVAWFTEGFDTPDLAEARTLLEELSAQPA
jgi:predicted ATPase